MQVHLWQGVSQERDQAGSAAVRPRILSGHEGMRVVLKADDALGFQGLSDRPMGHPCHDINTVQVYQETGAALVFQGHCHSSACDTATPVSASEAGI